MAMILTHGGRSFDFGRATAMDIDIADIAHSLANICRWNGHTKRFYSVAEHSFLMARYAVEKGGDVPLAVMCLMHDAPEAYLGDVTRPLKRALGEQYRAMEDRAWGLVCEKFCLTPWLDRMEQVHELDNRMIGDERAQAMCNPPEGFHWDLPDIPALGVVINFWEPHVAKSKFLEMWGMLGRNL